MQFFIWTNTFCNFLFGQIHLSSWINLSKMRHSSPYLVLNCGVINVLSLRMTKQSLLKSRSPFLLQVPLESLNCTPARAHHNHKCAFCAGHLGGENNKQLSICVDKKCMHMQQGGFMGPGHGQRLTRNNMCSPSPSASKLILRF